MIESAEVLVLHDCRLLLGDLILWYCEASIKTDVNDQEIESRVISKVKNELENYVNLLKVEPRLIFSDENDMTWILILS